MSKIKTIGFGILTLIRFLLFLVALVLWWRALEELFNIADRIISPLGFFGYSFGTILLVLAMAILTFSFLYIGYLISDKLKPKRSEKK